MMRMSYLSMRSVDPTEQIRYRCHMSIRRSQSWNADLKSAASISATCDIYQAKHRPASLVLSKVTMCP